MIIRKTYEVKGHKVPQPFERYVKTLIGPRDGAKAFEIGMTILPAGSNTGLHDHGDIEEAAYIISGRAELMAGSEDKLESVVPEMILYFPPRFKHGFINNGEESLKVMWMASPQRGIAKQVEELAKREQQA